MCPSCQPEMLLTRPLFVNGLRNVFFLGADLILGVLFLNSGRFLHRAYNFALCAELPIVSLLLFRRFLQFLLYHSRPYPFPLRADYSDYSLRPDRGRT